MELGLKQTSESKTTLHHNESIETLDTAREHTFIEKIKKAVRLITVEPAFFLYIFASLLAGAAISNMSFEMGCRVNLKFNDTICNNITTGIKHVHTLIAYHDGWARPLQQTVSMILVLCFGTFSDKHKIRKPFLTLPILGEVFSCLGLLLCAAFITKWPIEMYYVMALLVPAFFGGGQTLIMAIFSYISDLSTQEERTFRIGSVEIVSLILNPIAPAIAGFLFLKIGYSWMLSISLVLFAVAVLYVHVFVKEKPPPKTDIKLCLDVFNIKTVVVDMFKILIKKRVAYRRFLLIMTYVCYILIKGPNTAEGLQTDKYLLDKFNWNLAQVGYFRAYNNLVNLIGMFLTVTLLVKKVKMNDYMIVIISTIFLMIVSIWYAFSSNYIIFCIGSILGGFSGMYILAFRSVVTKFVDPSEFSKAQALFAVCEAICPFIYNNMFAAFLDATKDVFYGAFYLLAAALLIIPLIIVLGMYLLYKHDLEHPQPEHQQNGVEQHTNDIEIEQL